MPMLAEVRISTPMRSDPRQRFDGTSRDLFGNVALTDAIQQHDEFVTSHARHGIRISRHPIQPASHLLQELIARVMPEGVVHHFEPIEVANMASAQGRPVTVRMCGRLREAIIQQKSIREPGQATRQMPQLLVGRLQALRMSSDNVFECLDLAT